MRISGDRHRARAVGAASLLLLVTLGVAPDVVRAQDAPPAVSPVAKPFSLTVENIMRGPALIGFSPQTPRFSIDGKTLFFLWRGPGSTDPAPRWWAVDADGKNLRALGLGGASDPLPPAGAVFSPDRTRVVFEDSGDLFVQKVGAKEKVQITHTPANEFDPSWTRDGKRIVFRRGSGNRSLFELFVMPAEPDAPPRQLLAYTLEPPAIGVSSLTLSPDETQVLLTLIERPGDPPRVSVLPDYLGEFVTAAPARPNVGTPQGNSRLILVDVDGGKRTTISPPEELSQKSVRLTGAEFSPPVNKTGPSRLAVIARTSDNHDAWICLVDRTNGRSSPLVKETDAAWLGGPLGVFVRWSPSGDALYTGSERTGYAHLWRVDPLTGSSRALTNGPFELSNARLTPDNDAWIFGSTEVDAAERHVYKMDRDGGKRVKLSTLPGWNDATLAPDGKTIAILRSYTNQPPELYVQEAKPGAQPVKVTVSQTTEFLSYAWRDVPVVTIAARDGWPIRARLFSPDPAKKNGAAVVFVHGAGYLQNAHKGWSQYEREYMFHHLLTERGFTVLDVDYRASAGYGRMGRTAVYKNMGGKDVDDTVDAARWLSKAQGVDAGRIGVYGGSYGGFLTLMTLFREPDVFACGAALRPVTDWSKYNHVYTANILGLPADDPDAYRRSSPIYFADGLRKPLLICHGMKDSNVFFQDTVRLTQRLIELGKTDYFDVIGYPSEDHAFTSVAAWTDEYKRILRLFETQLASKGK